MEDKTTSVWSLYPRHVILLAMLAGYGLSHMEVSKWYGVAISTAESLGEAFFNSATIATELFGALTGFQLVFAMIGIVLGFIIAMLGLKLLILGRIGK